MKAVINSIKHYINVENIEVVSGTAQVAVIVAAVAQNAVAAIQDVVEGSLVKAVFLEFWVSSRAAAGTDTKFQLCVEKVPVNSLGVTFAQMNTLHGYVNKKNVLFFSQGVIGDLTTNSIPVVRQWFKIPKGKQRFGLGDRLLVTIGSTGAIMNRCGFSTYKEYK